jgi:RecA/RadA recombinase
MNMSKLMDKLRTNTTIKSAQLLKDSEFMNQKMIATDIPAVNIALSGSIDGGLTSGLTTIAGPSKHFKTAFGLLMMKSYLDSNPTAIALFYDSEFGTPQKYFETFDIDMTRVLHSPIMDIEQLKIDVVNQLNQLDKEDEVFIFVDSVGNLASYKEVKDALDGKTVADMTRAKSLKSLFRAATPYLKSKNIPMVVINHTYDSQEMFSKQVVSGGTGIYYSSDTIWIVGRRQQKEGTDVTGYQFVINVEKSRYVKEKSKIPISVSFDGGIDKWSGLLDMAIDAGIVSRSGAWYQLTDLETGLVIEKKFRAKELSGNSVWDPILASEAFKKYVQEKYMLVTDSIVETSEDLVGNV